NVVPSCNLPQPNPQLPSPIHSDRNILPENSCSLPDQTLCKRSVLLTGNDPFRRQIELYRFCPPPCLAPAGIRSFVTCVATVPNVLENCLARLAPLPLPAATSNISPTSTIIQTSKLLHVEQTS